MSFDDLPEHWDDLPLTDPRLVEDVLDLFAFCKDRRVGSLILLLCDDRVRLVQAVTVSEIDDISSYADRVRCISTVVTSAEDAWSSVLVAIARADGLSFTETDEQWARAAAAGCGPRVRLVGVHLVTMDGSRELPGELFDEVAS